MKKIIIILAALAIFQEWDDINAFINPPPDYGAAHDAKVTLYATEWCGYCKKARDLMDQNNIRFVEYDIEKSEQGRQQHKRLGGRGVPVLLIDGEVIHGFDAGRILKLARRN